MDLLLMADASTLTNFTVLDTDTVSPFVLNWTPQNAGNFNLRMRATDAAGDTGFSSVLSVAVTAAATTPASNVIYPVAANYSQNALDDTPSEVNAPYRLRSSFARIDLKNPAGGGVGLTFTFRGGNPSQLKLLKNNVELLTFASDGTANVRDIGIVPLGANETLSVIEGSQYSDQDQGDHLGSYLVSAYAPSGQTVSVVPPTKTASQFYFIHDSLPGGWALDRPINDSTIIVLRGLLGYDVVSDGWADRSFSHSLSTDAARTAMASHANASLNGRTKKIIWVQLSRNDARHPYGTSAQVKSILTT